MSGSPAARGWRESLGVLVLLTVLSFNMMLISAISPVLSTIAAHFGGGGGAALKAQMIITVSGLGIMIGGPLAGWLGDRIGLRRMLLLALAVYGLVGSAGLYLEGATLLLASRFVQGVATAGIGAASVAMLGNAFDGPTRSKLLGYQHAFLAVAGAITLTITGELARRFGWRAPFALYLTSFLVIGAVLLARFPDRAGADRAGAGRARPEAPSPSGALAAMWPAFLLVVFLYFAAYMFYLHLSFVMAGDGERNPAVQSRVLSAITVMSVVGGLFYGRVIARAGARRMLVLILALMGAACLVIGLSHGIPATVGGCIMAGLGGGGLGAYVADLVLQQAPVALRGRAMGLMYMSMYLGDFLNPLVVTPLRQTVGNHEAFAAVGAMLALGALIAMLRSRAAQPLGA